MHPPAVARSAVHGLFVCGLVQSQLAFCFTVHHPVSLSCCFRVNLFHLFLRCSMCPLRKASYGGVGGGHIDSNFVTLSVGILLPCPYSIASCRSAGLCKHCRSDGLVHSIDTIIRLVLVKGAPLILKSAEGAHLRGGV